MYIKKVLILGSTGLLGRQLVKEIKGNTGWDVITPTRSELDITDFETLEKFFKKNKFDAVVNCAAYTNVDDIETEKGYEKAKIINGKAPIVLAKLSKKFKRLFIHISTDYVFSEDRKIGYRESHRNRVPINRYGETKLIAEKGIEKLCGGLFLANRFVYQETPIYIVRTSWLFGKGATNFISKMIELSEKYKTLKVVKDEIGCPTYVKDLALRLIYMIETQTDSGIYHVTGAGKASRFNFAKQIFRSLGKRIEVLPTTLEEFGRTTGVPHYSILLNTKLPPMRDWDKMVDDFIRSEVRKG